ncbi:MAG: hypothetical protein L6428_06735 [Candidatus Aminicenantes bacterium]|nr:hypothetical protein [Candidatus Aminicenantes bacterium]
MKDENSFLHDFIKGEMYLQNPPMEMDEFIKYCEKLGVKTSKNELEFYEKEKLLFPIFRIERTIQESEWIKINIEGKGESWKQACDGLKDGETEIERCKKKYYPSYDFSEGDKDLLLSYFEEGYLFDPALKAFQDWTNFLGEELEDCGQKIVSYYSSFQIFWLERIKEISEIRFSHNLTCFNVGDCNLSAENGRIFLSANLNLNIEISDKEGIPLSGGEIYRPLDHQEAYINWFKNKLNWENKKKKLLNEYEGFNKILKFLLSVQSIYFPYARSGRESILVAGDLKKWLELKRNIDFKSMFKISDSKIEDVAKWYRKISKESKKLLGIKEDDWIQLWKSIALSKKDKLEGLVRLGLEYLQWALMLKKIIGDYSGEKIWDIDEIDDFSDDGIIQFDPLKMTHLGRSRREYRNERYSDETKNYYNDRYKRLFYLANDFGLDYQPRILIFLEGQTEEIILPKFFNMIYRNSPENFGVEFININSISNFFGQKISIKNANGKYRKGFINNFKHLISYNLEKWQMIPFFVGDAENNILSLLKNEISIAYNGNQYPFPGEWQYLWGITNNNNPFFGKDFEMANFNDEEIAASISTVLNKEILPTEIKKNREIGHGIKQLGKEVDKQKILINTKLAENLFNQCEKGKNKEISERPVFKVINIIRKLASLNHPPVNRKIELKNIKYFEGILKKREESMPICPYYKTEMKSYQDREKRLTRGQAPPVQFPIIWCNHKNSAQRKNEKGELACKGEIGKISSCPLIKNQQ